MSDSSLGPVDYDVREWLTRVNDNPSARPSRLTIATLRAAEEGGLNIKQYSANTMTEILETVLSPYAIPSDGKVVVWVGPQPTICVPPNVTYGDGPEHANLLWIAWSTSLLYQVPLTDRITPLTPSSVVVYPGVLCLGRNHLTTLVY
jgi:hypothetical protein